MTALYKGRRFQSEAQYVFKVDEYLTKPLRYDALRDALYRVSPPERRLTSFEETNTPTVADAGRIH